MFLFEPRPKGRPQGSPIEDYVVEDRADHVLGTFKTQQDAADWAESSGHTAHVARIRHLNDKKKSWSLAKSLKVEPIINVSKLYGNRER